MTKISEPKIQRLNLDLIEVGERMRPVSTSGVESLIASVEELGVIKDAIHVRKKRRGDTEVLVLMAGAHRLEAAKRLGWEAIPARVWADVTDDWARLMEIDDNLAGADLSALELAVFLAERKKVYERLHPETKAASFKGNQYTGKVASDIMSFATSVAEKRDLSKRHIERFVQIGTSLSAWEVEGLMGLEKPISMTDLMFLAKVKEEKLRVDLIDYLKHTNDEKRDLAGKLVSYKGEASAPPGDPIDVAFKQLLTAWSRAPMAARRRFVTEVESDLCAIMDGKTKIEVA
ncbi:hypothetical protein JI58_03660 [Marinosulfonomonas sp. PRT-SC04]|nr:hypothetical protein JI58_03660 [Marinosulfonomonas sp. PRT-SC04]